MPDTYLRLLGAPEVDHGGKAQPLRATAPHALLVYLAAADGWVTREELAYLFRPDDRDADALRYLRLQLHRAQQVDWAQSLEVADDRVRWSVDSDVARFRRALVNDDPAAAIEGYRGRFLDGFVLRGATSVDTWLDAARADLEAAYRGALAHQVAIVQRRGDWPSAAALGERRLAADPFDEEALRDLLHALLASGRRADAVRRLAVFETGLRAELGVAPEPATRALGEALRQAPATAALGLAESSETLAIAAWPRPTTRFVGRRRELADLASLLADPSCRLLSVVGLGGSGKTRLALEVARRHAATQAEPVAFVAGADVATQAQWLHRIGWAVGALPDRGRDAADGLIAWLAERRLLLVLDNLEHLPEATPWVQALLEGAPQVQVLATSRQPLDLLAEVAYDVSGLDLPPPGGATGEAVELFVDAARRSAPRLNFDAADLLQVADICRAVAGLPLGLELAATWTRAMPVAAIADALRADLAWLETDRADVPARHRRLGAVLTRTWDDLTEAKRDLLLRLVPFVGGCSMATAKAVTGAPPTLWLSLLRQALLARRTGDRWAPHPLVAAHAAAHLAREPDRQVAARDAHAAHFVAVLERAAGPGSDGLIALDDDAADLEAAWAHLLARGDGATLLRIAPAFFERYDVRGQFRAGLDAARATLAGLAGAPAASMRDVRDSLSAVVHLAAATLAWEAGDYASAHALVEAALEAAQRADRPDVAARAQQRRGDVLQSTGDFEAAAAAYAQAERGFADRSDERGQADVLNSWASMDAVRERHAQAQSRFLRCAELFERLGATKDTAIAQTNLGFVAEALGQLDSATRHYERALAVFERIGFVRGQAAVQNNLVVLLGKQRRFEQALAMGRASLAAKDAIGDTLSTVVTLKNLGDLELLRDDPQAALTCYAPAVRIALSHGAVPRLLQVLVGMAEALMRRGETDLAGRVAHAVAAHPSATDSLVTRARRLQGPAVVPAVSLEQVAAEALAAL